MLELELDDSLADFCQDVADPRTRITLHGTKRLSAQFVQDLMEVGERQTLQERVTAVFRQYRKDHNPDYHITDPLKIIVGQYEALAEFGVKFECADIEVMGDYALKTASWGVEKHLFHEMALPVISQYIDVCSGVKKTGAVIASVDALQRSGRRNEVVELALPQILVQKSLERIMLSLPYPKSRAAQVEYGEYITSVQGESIRTLAELVEDKSVLTRMIRKRLRESNVQVDRMIPIAAATGDFADVEAFCHTIGIHEEGVRIQQIYEISKAPHLLHRLENIAWQQIELEDFNSHSMSVYPWIRKFVQMDDEKIRALADRKIKQAFPKMETMNLANHGALHGHVRNLCYHLDGAMILYESLGMTENDIRPRIRDMALEANALKVASRLIVSFADEQAKYKLGLKFAEQGDYESAFRQFTYTNLERVPTNDRLFYETIARRIMPVLATGISPDHIKRKINSTIKKFCIRDITIADEHYVIDFGIGYFSVKAGKTNVVSRNGIQDVSYGFIVRDIHKKHRSEEELKAEKFWIDYLGDKAPVKKIVRALGNTLVLETSAGIPLLDAAPDLSVTELEAYLKKSSAVADRLYRTINEDKDVHGLLEEEGINYHLDAAAIDHRFDRFLKGVDDAPLQRKVKGIQARVKEYLLASKQGITHADFSPRNLMIEDSDIVVLDHENYREGHPISQIVSLVVYPYVLHSKAGDFTGILDHWAQEYGVGKEEIQLQKLYWSIRQAGAIAGKPKLSKFYDSFVQEVEKAL